MQQPGGGVEKGGERGGGRSPVTTHLREGFGVGLRAADIFVRHTPVNGERFVEFLHEGVDGAREAATPQLGASLGGRPGGAALRAKAGEGGAHERRVGDI